MPGVQTLQQVVGGELDLLVPPLGGPVLAGDDAHAVQPAQVAVDERVPGLGLILGTVGEPEMPLCVPRRSSTAVASGVALPAVRPR
jgi:hypothetical protein